MGKFTDGLTHTIAESLRCYSTVDSKNRENGTLAYDILIWDFIRGHGVFEYLKMNFYNS